MARQHHSIRDTRRAWLAGIAALALFPLTRTAHASAILIQVWKDPNCGCCKDWIALLEKSGFATTVIDQGNNAARARLGMPQKFGSCHTALVQGYVVEGHVPVADIQRLLKEKPRALGLSAYGGRRDPYQVLLIQRDGSTSVFNTYQ
jgi:hypothetical protein